MRKKIQSARCQTQPGPPAAVGECATAQTANSAVSPAADSAPPPGGLHRSGSDPGSCGAAPEARNPETGGERSGFAAEALIFIIGIYQRLISPWLPCRCRFEPTCSHYAVQALQIHGLWKGSWLTVWRIMRCQPFCRGGYDPVPPRTVRTAADTGKPQ